MSGVGKRVSFPPNDEPNVPTPLGVIRVFSTNL